MRDRGVSGAQPQCAHSRSYASDFSSLLRSPSRTNRFSASATLDLLGVSTILLEMPAQEVVARRSVGQTESERVGGRHSQVVQECVPMQCAVFCR